MSNQIQSFKSVDDFRIAIAKDYKKQLDNFFGDEKKALEFMSNMVACIQRTPKLMECTPESLINSFITMASLKLMPSGVSGEAYVLPYNKSIKVGNTYQTVLEAQFQLGYQGIITLFYRAGGQKVRAEIVRENDKFSYENGEILHSIDIFKSNEQRGKAVGAYAIATINGQEIAKAMNALDILAMGKKFSKSFGGKHTPWDEDNDPELWMWKKTVLKQLAKMMPKNETINKAIAEDNKDSVIADRLGDAMVTSKSLSMGALIKPNNETKHEDEANKKAQDLSGEENQDVPAAARPTEEGYKEPEIE